MVTLGREEGRLLGQGRADTKKAGVVWEYRSNGLGMEATAGIEPA